MYRTVLATGAALAAVGATQIAAAEPAKPLAAATQGSGLSVTPSVLETTARRNASATATIGNSTGRKLSVTVRVRPWRQARSGTVAADRRRRLSGVGVNVSSFTMPAGARRSVRVSLRRMSSKRSQYGALEIVGRPARRRRGINVTYRLVSSVRFNPTARARRYSLGAGQLRRSGRTLSLQVRNRGNTVDPVGGRAQITGPAGGASAAITSVRILPGKLVNVRLATLPRMRRGSYTARISLRQRGRTRLTVTRRFRIG